MRIYQNLTRSRDYEMDIYEKLVFLFAAASMIRLIDCSMLYGLYYKHIKIIEGPIKMSVLIEKLLAFAFGISVGLLLYLKYNISVVIVVITVLALPYVIYHFLFLFMYYKIIHFLIVEPIIDILYAKFYKKQK